MNDNNDNDGSEQQHETYKIDTPPTLDGLNPSDATPVDGLKGVGRFDREEVGNVHANWMAFDPTNLIEVLERFHSDEVVFISTTWKESKAGVESPMMTLADIDSGDLSVIVGLVGGEDAKTAEQYAEENDI